MTKVDGMNELTWKVTSEDSEDAYSGDLRVGFIMRLADNTGYVFDLSAVHTKYITLGSGHVDGPTQAKSNLQKAWNDWCYKAGLVKGPSE